MPDFIETGVLYDGGKRCMTKGSPGTPSFSYSYLTSGMMGFGRYEKITEEEAIAIENAGDPIEAPPG